jgi:CRISPR-associated protein Cmr2
MRPALAELKIEALLHDPPGKTPMLWYRNHERFADELVEIVLGRGPRRGAEVYRADRYASAVDRVVLSCRGSSPDADVLTATRTDFLRDPEIVHPIAGTRYDLRTLGGLDLNAIADAQRRAVASVVEAAGGVGGDAERLYWYLWRGLPAAVEGAGELGKLWRYLPADTRVPDHPIWDHIRLTSAFAGASPDPALLVFSFGPVQSLVEAARRTGDLWAGSFLLSWLAWRAMRPIVVELGADAVLFPDLHGQPLIDRWLAERGWRGIPGHFPPRSSIASLPNRFLALVPCTEGKRLAEEAEGALRASALEFVEEGASFLDRVARPRWRERAARQCSMTFSCQWHVLPWRADDRESDAVFGGEGELRRVTEAALGAAIAGFWRTRDLVGDREVYRPNLGTFFEPHSRLAEAAHGAAKASRRFEQIDEVDDRCRVCGTREALWGGEADRESDRAILDRYVKKGEWLCAVCSGRRYAPKSDWARALTGGGVLFPSTHNLAAARFFEEVLDRLRAADGRGAPEDQAVAKAVERFVEATRGAERTFATGSLMARARRCGLFQEVAEDFVRSSAELLDPSTYELRNVGEGSLDEIGLDARQAAAAREALANLRKACDGAGIRRPGAYYAVLVMDGDHMGQWLSGERAPRICEILHTSALPADTAPWLDRPRPLSSAHQVAVSRALNQFALEVVPRIVEDVHGGVVVYAGGDDVLAMVPLHAVLGCLEDLRRLYSGWPLDPHSAAGREGWESDNGHVRWRGRLFQVMGQRATSSAGVAIAHAKWPLRHALDTAREMERVAKRVRDRNAVAIALLKRSGGHERFAARWGEGDGVGPFHPLRALDAVRWLIAEDGVSRRFAYALREEAPALWGLKDALEERTFWLVQHHRRREAAGRDGADAAAVEAADDAKHRPAAAARGLRELAEALDRWTGDARRGGSADRSDPIDEFRAAVGLAEFLAREGSE